MSIESLNGVKPGDFYTTDGTDVWRVQSLCERPTIKLVQVDGEAVASGAVGCLNLKPFRRLIPEGEEL